MAVINFARREIEAKIVYYGPALSGKTTNVSQAHGTLPEEDTGDLRKLETRDERTLFFDYVPITRGEIAGFTIKFKLFSVPGQVFYRETRRIVLQGVDGVVFVADSDPERAQANIDCLMDLEDNLRHYKLELARTPLVIQFNKRDLPEVRAVQSLNADLNPLGVPIIEAIATDGVGVMETLEAVTGIVSARIRDGLAGRRTGVSLAAIDSRAQQDDEAVVKSYMSEIEKVRPMEEARGRSALQRFEIDTTEVDAFLLANVERDEQAPPAKAGPTKTLKMKVPPKNDERPAQVEIPPDTERRPTVPVPDVAVMPEDLPPGPSVELGFLPNSLKKYEVSKIISAEPSPNGGVILELFMESMDGGMSRCRVDLKPEPRKRAEPRQPRPQPQRILTEPIPQEKTTVFTVGVAASFFVLGISLALAFFSAPQNPKSGPEDTPHPQNPKSGLEDTPHPQNPNSDPQGTTPRPKGSVACRVQKSAAILRNALSQRLSAG